MNLIRHILQLFGRRFLEWSTTMGQVANLVIQTFYWISRGAIDPRNTVTQMVEVGWNSMPVIGLTSLFTGMVLALQTGSSFKNIFNEPVYVGTVVGFSLVKELGPVLTSIVVAGRVGAAIAAELGTMKVTEQIDALYTLGTNPVRHLAVPRFLACMVMVPMLTILSNVIGILGGLLISVVNLGVPSSVYWDDILSGMRIDSLMHGLVKACVFGMIIVTVSCYRGFNCEGGAEGVGKATTSAVMIAMALILISDYFLTALLVALNIG